MRRRVSSTVFFSFVSIFFPLSALAEVVWTMLDFFPLIILYCLRVDTPAFRVDVPLPYDAI